MKVGHQIQVRMDQLGVSVQELAKRVGVSAQAVRYWVSGRSFPGKRHAPKVENALSFNLDFTEGAGRAFGRKDADEIMGKEDMELLLLLSRLDPRVRLSMRQLVATMVSAQEGQRTAFTVRRKSKPVEAFVERASQKDIKRSRKRVVGR